MKSSLPSPRILIVDDQPASVALLEALLAHWGYTSVTGTSDSTRAVSLFDSIGPDLVLLDLSMPAPNGFDLLRNLVPLAREPVRVPIVVVTADRTPNSRRRALAMGASDFLTKPFDPVEVRLRVENLLNTRCLQLQLRSHGEMLEQRVRERTRDLERARTDAIERLALAAEYRDDASHEHAQRVGRTAALLARGQALGDEQVELIRQSAPLHDIGKLALSDAILLKPGRLTARERKLMELHTTLGGELLSDNGSRLLAIGRQIALTHHEHWDGNGYPRGLSREQIPLAGRIVALADVFDALTHARPYKPAWPLDAALAEIRAAAGHQLDPGLVEAFEELDHELLLSPLRTRRFPDCDARGRPSLSIAAPQPL